MSTTEHDERTDTGSSRSRNGRRDYRSRNGWHGCLAGIILLLIAVFSGRAATTNIYLGNQATTNSVDVLTNYLLIVMGSGSNAVYRLINISNVVNLPFVDAWASNKVQAATNTVADSGRTELNSASNALQLAKQPASSTLTNLANSGALTNVINDGVGASQIALTNGISSLRLKLKSLSGGSNVTLTDQSTNISIAASATDTSGLQTGSLTLTNIVNGIHNWTNENLYSSSVTNPNSRIWAIASARSNLTEWVDSTGALLGAVKSNGQFIAFAGTTAKPSFATLDDLTTGMSHGAAGSTWSVIIAGSEAFRFADNTIQGLCLGASGNPLTWGTLGNSDLRLYRDAAAVSSWRAAANPNTNNIYGTYTSASSGEKLELGYNGTHAWFFLESQTNGAGTLRPLAFGVTSNASVVVDVTRGVTVRGPLTNIVTVNLPTNTASFNSIGSAGQHIIAVGQGWTNDLGARADMVISVTYTDAVTGDPKLAFTNTITGEGWTNAFSFGIAGAMTELLIVPDISPSDYGSFTDRSGSGASVVFNSVKWKLK